MAGLDRLEVVDESEDVDIDLLDDLELLRQGGVTDLDWSIGTGEDPGDTIGVLAGETVGVITGDITVGVEDGDKLGESMDIMEEEFTVSVAVDVAVASLKMSYNALFICFSSSRLQSDFQKSMAIALGKLKKV